MTALGQNRHLSGVSVTDGLPSIAEGQCPRTRHWQLDPYFRTKASGIATEEFVGWSIKSQALGTRTHPAVMQWRTTDRRNACRSKKARGGRRTAIPWPRRTAIALSRSSPRRVGKRGKTGGGMNLRFTGGHELDSFWECCRPPTSMAYRTPI